MGCPRQSSVGLRYSQQTKPWLERSQEISKFRGALAPIYNRIESFAAVLESRVSEARTLVTNNRSQVWSELPPANSIGGQLVLLCVATELTAKSGRLISTPSFGTSLTHSATVDHESADCMPSIFRFLPVLSIYPDGAYRRNACSNSCASIWTVKALLCQARTASAGVLPPPLYDEDQSSEVSIYSSCMNNDIAF